MTTGLRHVQAAAIIHAQIEIADGTLRPGQAAPSGAQLARFTGFCAITCRRALRDLVDDGTLVRGISHNARPRVVTLHWSDGTESVFCPSSGPAAGP